MVLQRQSPKTRRTASLAKKLHSVAVLMVRDLQEARIRRRDAEVIEFAYLIISTR
jgi:hypothetical protein